MISQIGRKKQQKNKRRQTAFTFLELLFVVIILSILISAALPNFRNTYENIKLKNAAWELYSLLEYLQDRALIEQKVFRLNIDETNNLLSLFVLKDNEFIAVSGQYLHKKDIPKTLIIESGTDTIDFFPGESIVGGDITLQNLLEKKITLRKNIYGYTIEE